MSLALQEFLLLDKLFRRFGYVPAVSTRLVNDEPAAVESPLPPHRLSAASFDFRAAACDELCFSYSDGRDFYSYAVGRDGWAPIAVAGLALIVNDRCSELLHAASGERLSVPRQVIQAWHEANAADFESDVIPRLSAMEMGAEFARCWVRARAAWPVFFLANSPAQIVIARHHTAETATDAAVYALERCTSWLAVWFESRGLGVDREKKLVKLEG